ncbi:MAG: cytochrome c peroxidase [Deferrisomatales bacterium]|nr:cytochrome c peroxidase [Deferrisomatales bacterium]
MRVLGSRLLLCAVALALSAPTLVFGAVKGDQLVALGGALYRDLDLSLNQNQACMTCHHPSAGFADKVNRVAPTLFPVSEGSVAGMFGGRNAPSAAYAGFAPIFYYDTTDKLFIGGTFWDGRATGWTLGDPLAEQALGPFLNPVEMALPDAAAVVDIVENSSYAPLFKQVFGRDIFADVATAYDSIGLAIAAFEKSSALVTFKSRFDQFIAEQGGDVSGFGIQVIGDVRQYVGPPVGFQSKVFSYDEADGLALFNADSTNDGTAATAGGMCYLCHLTTNAPIALLPILTDFSYDNLGVPVNPQVAVLAGPQAIDYGLGAKVVQLETAFGEPLTISNEPDGLGGLTTVVTAEAGKFKVPTLRNVARSAPYGHNGFFPTLYDVVHFYNSRDVQPPAWPTPEVGLNVNETELGNLGLSLDQEMKLVLFLETLTD